MASPFGRPCLQETKTEIAEAPCSPNSAQDAETQLPFHCIKLLMSLSICKMSAKGIEVQPYSAVVTEASRRH